jgi:hypothetical protein
MSSFSPSSRIDCAALVRRDPCLELLLPTGDPALLLLTAGDRDRELLDEV